jgi:glycosyltransferase involved in cell wall biosynthesis
MKIVHWAKFYPPEWGGTELVNYEEATAAAAQGDEVTVVAFTRGEARSEIEQGVRVVRAKVAGGIDSQPLSWRWFVRAVGEAREADVLHIHTPNLLAAPALLWVSRRTRIILQWQTDLVDKGLLGWLARPLEIYMAHRAHVLIASSAAYAQASPILRRAGTKTRPIPLGIPDPAIAAASATLPATVVEFLEGRPYALAVGRNVPYKGFEYLIRAAERLHTAGAIVIVGTGPLEPLYREMIAKLGVEDRVLLAGRMGSEDLNALFRSAALYVMSSVKRSEAFGIVTLEAMGHSLPVVATQIEGSGVAWVAGDGETGPIVPPRDPDALARAIDGLFADAAARAAFGKASRARYERLFTNDRMNDAVLALYRAPETRQGTATQDAAKRGA